MYWEEDEDGVKGDALLSASVVTPPEAEGIWVGDVGVESIVMFVKANGVEGGDLEGGALKYIM